MKLDDSIDKVFIKIKSMCGNSPDIVTRILNTNIGYIYFESVSSDDKVSNFLTRAIINNTNKNIFSSVYSKVKNSIYCSNMNICDNYDNLFYYLSSGFTAIIINGFKKAIVVETRAKLDRGVVESSSEPIIRGPKDSFSENHNTNIGLIRKRIKDKNLHFKDLIIGRRTKTKVTISYIYDIVPNYKIKDLINSLNKINIDGILDSGYIRELIEKNQKSLFPKVISTERPDLACSQLLDGKIVILVE